MSVRIEVLNRTSVILATAQLPQRRKAPMFAPAQMNSGLVRVPNTTGLSSQ